MPWKNRGGVTREVAAHPPGAGFDTFGWRVSVASVEQSGPFSVFFGIDRHIALFEGELKVGFGNYGILRLAPDVAPLAFPGDVPAEARLISAPVTDLNVMTRRGAFTARLSRKRIEDMFACAPRATTLIFPLAPAALAGGDVLEVQDAVMAEPAEPVSFAAAADCYVAEIFPAR